MVDVAGGIEPAVVNSPHSAGVIDVQPAARRQSYCLQADVVGSRCSAGGEEYLVDPQLGTVVQLEDHWASWVGAAQRAYRYSHAHVNAGVGQSATDEFPHKRFHSGQQARSPHGFEGITGLSAILITHQHPDHIDVTRLPTLLEDNPAAELYADPQTAAQLGEPWRAVHVGDELPLAELTVRAVGGCHAVIHPEIPVIENISYLVGDSKHRARLMHPGDALFVPGEQVDVLATPAAAPWMKISEAVDYLRAVAPARAVPIHQAIVAPDARGIYYGRLTEMTTTDFQVLPEESAVTF